MKTFFETDINYLYSSGTSKSDTQAVYNIDPFINDYTSLNTINSRITFDDYLIRVSTIEIVYQSVAEVVAISGDTTTAARTQAIAAPPAPIPAGCPAPVTNTGAGGTAAKAITTTTDSTDFSGDITKWDINININNDTALNGPSREAMGIMDEMKNRIDILSDILIARDSISAADSATKFTRSHTNFSDYMSEINTSVGSYYFKRVYKYIAENLDRATPPRIGEDNVAKRNRLEADKVRLTAIANLRMILIPWRFEPMMQALREASKRSLNNMMASPVFNSVTFINAFANRGKMTVSPTNKEYFTFRSKMYDYFVMDKKITSEDDLKIKLFMKKLLVDIFIKTCYPLIHFDLLDALVQKYIAAGNFINARMALISKCLLTYSMVDKVYNKARSEGPDNTYNTITRDIPTNIVNYIDANNRGSVNLADATVSVEQRMSNIIKGLQTLSNEVADNSLKTHLLQKAIADNQLTMRNVSLAIEQTKGGLYGKQVEFWILFSFLIVIIISCSLLYFFDMVNIGLMISAGVMIIVLALKLIMMIVSYVNK